MTKIGETSGVFFFSCSEIWSVSHLGLGHEHVLREHVVDLVLRHVLLRGRVDHLPHVQVVCVGAGRSGREAAAAAGDHVAAAGGAQHHATQVAGGSDRAHVGHGFQA